MPQPAIQIGITNHSNATVPCICTKITYNFIFFLKFSTTSHMYYMYMYLLELMVLIIRSAVAIV